MFVPAAFLTLTIVATVALIQGHRLHPRELAKPALAVVLFLIWAGTLQVLFGLDNLRHALGWTIGLWPF